jgi:hypothetical protein
MRTFNVGLMALVIVGTPTLVGNARAFGPVAAGPAAGTPTAVAPAACREKRWGWHGRGWYPCKVPVNTCEKCKWHWGYKYCWRIC